MCTSQRAQKLPCSSGPELRVRCLRSKTCPLGQGLQLCCITECAQSPEYPQHALHHPRHSHMLCQANELPGMRTSKAHSLPSSNDGAWSMRRKLRSWRCSLQGTAIHPTPGALRVWPCSQRMAPSSMGVPLRAAPTIRPSTHCRPHASRLQPRGRAPFQRYASCCGACAGNMLFPGVPCQDLRSMARCFDHALDHC